MIIFQKPWERDQPPPLGAQVNPEHLLSNRLHGLWLFNERGGSVLHDASRKDRLGDLQGTSIPIWGLRGLLFDNVDSQVNFGTRPSLSGTTDFTFTTRIQKSTSTLGYIFGQRNGGFLGAYLVEVNVTTGTVRVLIVTSASTIDFSGVKAVNDGVPHTVSVVRRGNNIFIYIDGLQDATASGTVGSLVNTLECHMGFNVRDSIGPFNGVISYGMLHSRALTDPELLGIHLNPYAVVVPAPRRMWVPAAVGGKGVGPFTELSVMALPGMIHSFLAKDPAGAAGDVFFENRHPIEHGMKPQTAAGLGGVLID